MNKKFLSAILFGAMLATSAGTFVSCKDYDDDIKGLQTQIDTNKTAIAELQKLVGAGNWVTSVAASGENLVVTMSNGTTATIAGIKGADGVDGKNAAEWTISEDGFWCKDGEKTTNVAVAQNGKDGKDGVTAPSPTISDNGMWVVYSWDAAKGEFVAEETEIPAAGTSAYAVKANGIYTLYIADADGEMQEIALPATCDAIVVEAPYKHVDVKFEIATWNKWSLAAKTEATKDAAKALLAKYPAIADIKKDAPMKQGGMLPLIVTPAAVELTDAFSFSLQNVDGTVADIELSAPVKGADMAFSTDANQDQLNARSASNACIWSLNMEPAYDKKKYTSSTGHYASTENKASLVVENEKGTVVRTAFAYTVTPEPVTSDVTITPAAVTVPFAESIDLFAQFKKDNDWYTPIVFDYEYKNHYVIAVANPLQAEMYGLSIAEDGHTLNITKMPASETQISVKLSVVALGLNGSIANSTVELTIGQEIAANEGITPAEVTLSKKDQIVTWEFKELGLNTATMVDKFFGDVTVSSTTVTYANTIKLAVTREADKIDKTATPEKPGEDGDVEKYVAYYGDVTFYNAKDKATKYLGQGEWSEDAPVKFGFTVDSDAKPVAGALDKYESEGWTEDVYTVSLKSEKGNTVVYTGQTELTVKNPELTTDYVKVVSAYVEDGVLQITGAPSTTDKNEKIVSYDLSNALTTANGATIIGFVDYDNDLYEGDDEEEYAFYNWVETSPTLIVSQWVYEPEDLTNTNWIKAAKQQLYQVRNIRAKVKLFNSDNVVPFDFKVIVKSEIYAEEGKDAITIDATKLKGTFKALTATGKENEINVTKAITAKAVAGEGKGKTYPLFATKDSYGNTTIVNYGAPKNAGGFVLATGGTSVYGLSGINYLNYREIFGGNVDQEIVAGTKTLPLSLNDYQAAWGFVERYKNSDFTDKYQMDANNKVVTVTYYDTEEQSGSYVYVTEKKNEDGTYDQSAKKVLVQGASVYAELYNAALINKETLTAADEAALKAMTVIPADHKKIVDLVNAIKGGIAFESTSTTGTGSKTAGTARDGRIESVKIAFNNPAEADKFFTITYADADAKAKFMEDGIIFEDAKGTTGIKSDATDYNPSAGDFILTAKESANVTVTTGKVVVDMKLIVEDKWGMIMEIPFSVEVSTVK